MTTRGFDYYFVGFVIVLLIWVLDLHLLLNYDVFRRSYLFLGLCVYVVALAFVCSTGFWVGLN